MEFTECPAEFRQRYRPERLIGEGGMGRVFLAHDTTLDRKVAVKLLNAKPASENAHVRMIREARAMAALDHPGLVRILNAELSGVRPVIVLEWLDGQPLSQTLASGKLSAAVATAILDRMLDALSFMHGRGFLHRDLKPSNVFLRNDGEPVLIDFGLATLEGDGRLTGPGIHMGTARYFAPELFRGEAASRATDLFAVGLIGLELLTLQDIHEVASCEGDALLPRLGSSLLSGAYFAAATRALSPFGQLGEVLSRSLQPDPANRFPDADQMRTVLNRTDPAPRRSPHATRVLVPRPATGGPGRWIRIGGVIAVALVGFGFLTRANWAAKCPPVTASSLCPRSCHASTAIGHGIVTIMDLSHHQGGTS